MLECDFVSGSLLLSNEDKHASHILFVSSSTQEWLMKKWLLTGMNVNKEKSSWFRILRKQYYKGIDAAFCSETNL